MKGRFDLGEWGGIEWADVEELEHRLQRRRWGVWLVAAAVSLLFHGILWWRFPQVFLGPLLPERVMRRAVPVRVERVEIQPPVLPKGTRGSAEDGGAIPAAPIAFSSQAVDEGKLVPSPPPAVRIGPSEWAPFGEKEEQAGSLRDQLMTRAPSWTVVPEHEKRILLPDSSVSVPPPDLLLPSPTTALSMTQAEAKPLRGMSFEEMLELTNAPTIPFAPPGSNRIEEAIRPAIERVHALLENGGSGEIGIPDLSRGGEGRLSPSGPPMTPVEKRLRAELRIWRDRREPEYVYTRVEIHRAAPEVLPVLPKDLLLIQDTSGSITEDRLEYCRQGLLRLVGQLHPGDRFNLLQFKDRPQFCFPDWVPVEPANIEAARQYILRMVSKGLTDISASLAALSTVSVQPGRPAIVIFVTDGLPTAGERDSAAILAEFTHRNRGSLSVFVLAVHDQANMYLLDMLSYMNRGDTLAARRGRWTIPETMDRLFIGLSRPVLTGMELRFAGRRVECFPVRSPNLYLDRPLVFYGRYPVDEQRVVFQVVGHAGDRMYDMVFDLPFETAQGGEESIREEWAWHKIYTLIGRHAVERDPQALQDLFSTSRQYGLAVPYSDRLSPVTVP